MADKEQLATLKRGVVAWNSWKSNLGQLRPRFNAIPHLYADLSEADLSNMDLSDADFDRVDLRCANLSGSKLVEASFIDTHLEGADLTGTDLSGADLSMTYLGGTGWPTLNGGGGSHLSNAGSASLEESNLGRANLEFADLHGVSLRNADLSLANFRRANLRNADLTKAKCSATIFVECDLSTVKGLETIEHLGPSHIGIDTLYLSKGSLPEIFLRGTGVPEILIHYAPSLIGGEQAIQFYSCFISYSHRDEEFAKHLHSRLRDAGIRVWFAPEDVKGGQRLHDQIERAIPLHDRLLLVLSENSLSSEWVITEIRRARKVKYRDKRRKLFPIRLIDMETIREWECFDADTGKDLAVEVREYYIPDFSNWKEYDAFEQGFKKLVRDLQEENPKQGRT